MKSNNRKSVSSQKTWALSPKIFIALGFAMALALICIVCTSFASGFGEKSSSDEFEQVSDKAQQQTDFASDDATKETEILAANSKRDISDLYQKLEDEEIRIEKEKQEAQKLHDDECIKKALVSKKLAGNPADGVDFTIGRSAFVELWAKRIDNYLAGYPLAGYGKYFADAAFEYGIDPRISPAISNTESTRGRHCFRSHNAWGWMQTSLGVDWPSAIYAHVKGWSNGYGYSLTLASAKKYCPPSFSDWYSKTKSQLDLI